ncbi:MAG: hypothetical protein IJY88_02160, partial [Clostridia bacterium]|nr:hypothetical protein [Clostridia bacterium]
MSTFRERNQKRKEIARTGGISSPSVSSRNSTFSDRFQERKNKMKQEPKSATNLPSLSESILSQDKYRPMTSFAAADKVIASKKTPFLPHVDIGVSEDKTPSLYEGAASHGISKSMVNDARIEALDIIEKEKAKYKNKLAPFEEAVVLDSLPAQEKLPVDIENKYGHKYDPNTLPVTQYMQAVKSGKIKGSRVTDSILNSQRKPEAESNVSQKLDYMFNMGLDKINAAYMSKKEKDLYFQIMMNEGVESADAYYGELEPHLKKRRSEEYESLIEDVVKDANGWENAVLTGGEVASTLLSPLNYPLTVYETLSGSDVGINNLGLDTATNTIASDISEESELGSWIYQLGLSGMKSGMTMLATGGNPVATQIIMGADAASSTIKEGKKRGLSPEQAVIYGTSVGIIEGVTERIGIDAFFGGGKNIFARILKNAAAEGAEEGISEILSNMADVVVNQDQSTMIMRYNSYIDQGYSGKEALGYMLRDLAFDVAKSFAGGALIGSGFGTASGVINTFQQSAADTELGNTVMKGTDHAANVQKLIDAAKDSGNKKLERTANKVQKSYSEEKGFDTSEKNIGKLTRLSEEQRVKAMVTAASADGIKSQTIAKLTESGMKNREAERAFELITRDATKEQVSQELADLMHNNNKIRPIYEEMTEYMSEASVLKRVADAQLSSPVVEVIENITNEQRKAESFDDDADIFATDDPISIEKIDDNGNYIVKTESGASVAYDPREGMSRVSSVGASKLSYASLHGLEGANAYLRLAPDNSNSDFDKDFEVLYSSGMLGQEFSLIESAIHEETQRAIYNAGKLDFQSAAEKSNREYEEAKKKEAAFVKKQMGFKSNRVTISEDAVAKIKSIAEQSTREQYSSSVAVIDALATMLQVNINIVASKTDAEGNYIDPNGKYNPETNSFTFDITAGLKNASEVAYTAMVKTAGHELTHFIQNWSPSKYITLRDNTVRFLQKRRGESWVDKQVENIVNNNSIAGKELTRNQAIDELVADSFEEVLTEIDFAETLLRADETLFGKLRRWIKDHIANFKKNLYAAVGDLGPKTKAGAEMRLAGKEARARFEEWSDAFVTAYENSTSQQSKDSENTEQLQARYSEDAIAFAEDIEKWDKNGKPENVSFVLGTTGDVLQGLGAIENDIYMLGDKIVKILSDHPEMTLDEIKKVPQILENPILVLHSKGIGRGKRQNTRLVIFGLVKAKNNRYVLTSLDLRPQEGNLIIDDMQKVTSAYTKTTNPVEFIKKSDVLYADKNKTAKLLRSIGFRMPIELQQSGYIGSISYFERSVNIKGKPFSEIYTEKSEDTQYQARNTSD